jgi:hypothetical protein
MRKHENKNYSILYYDVTYVYDVTYTIPLRLAKFPEIAVCMHVYMYTRICKSNLYVNSSKMPVTLIQ